MASVLDDAKEARSRRRMVLSIAALVLVWGAAMLNRHAIRAGYYAYRLTHADDQDTHLYYLSRLAGMREKAVGPAGRLLHHPDAGIRSSGVAVLHHARSERARKLLLGAMDDPDEEVRRLAVLGLAFFHEARAVPALVKMLAQPTEYPAREAAVALERIGTAQGVTALVHAAGNHPILNVRAQATDSLGRLGDEAAIDTLIELLSDETPLRFMPASDQAVKRALQQAGLELARQGIGPEAVASQPAPPATVADLAARALRRITKESFDFRSSDPPERKKNAIRLWKIWARQRHAA